MNKVLLLGRIAKDPELRTFATDKKCCTFTFAVPRPFAKEGDTKVDFLPVVLWNKAAEICTKHCKKGSQIVVVGRIQTRTWDDNEGRKRYATEIIGEEFHFAGSKPADAASSTSETLPLVSDDELPF
jgi:single-strand DNA-binding protein